MNGIQFLSIREKAPAKKWVEHVHLNAREFNIFNGFIRALVWSSRLLVTASCEWQHLNEVEKVTRGRNLRMFQVNCHDTLCCPVDDDNDGNDAAVYFLFLPEKFCGLFIIQTIELKEKQDKRWNNLISFGEMLFKFHSWLYILRPLGFLHIFRHE